MKTVRVEASGCYDVMIGSGILDQAGALLQKIMSPCRAAIITDDIVQGLFGSRVEKSLQAAGFKTEIFAFPNGEKQKTLQTLADALEWLAEIHLSRSDLVVALGGGVPGDLAGFAAAVYCRGVRFIQIPTTLLAAVDSSVGGKTAVDLKAGKNLAGAFHQPELVICDTDIMKNLPPELRRDGAAKCSNMACWPMRRFLIVWRMAAGWNAWKKQLPSASKSSGIM